MFLTTVVVYYIADTYRNKSDIFETYEIQSDLPSFIFGKPFWNDDYVFNEKKNPEHKFLRTVDKLENIKRDIDELQKEENKISNSEVNIEFTDEDLKAYLRAREEQQLALAELKKTFRKNLRKYRLHPDDINYD